MKYNLQVLFLLIVCVHAAHGAAYDVYERRVISYAELLEERRNIPKTLEEYNERRLAALEYVHKMEQQSPGKTLAYLRLYKVLDYGWANTWWKKNPGWSDIIAISTPIAVIALMIAMIVIGERVQPAAGNP